LLSEINLEYFPSKSLIIEKAFSISFITVFFENEELTSMLKIVQRSSFSFLINIYFML